MSVKSNLRGLKDLEKKLKPFYRGVSQNVARKMPEKIIVNIMKQKQGINEKASLPVNATSTINRKKVQGKPLMSLVDNRKLIKRSTWEVKKSGSGYKVTVKKKRQEAALYLHQGIKSKSGTRYYKFMTVPRYMPSWIKTFIKMQTVKFFSKYV